MPKEVLQGTLDLMVLRTLETMGPQHGFGLAKRILQISEGLLDLNQGTLYPALLRLEQRRWIKSKWGISDNNRQAKFYELTPRGRKQIAEERESWDLTVSLMNAFCAIVPLVRNSDAVEILESVPPQTTGPATRRRVRYHIESLEIEHRARGLSAQEARRAARHDFGVLPQIEETYRDQRGIPMLETLLRDIRFSLRSMRRTPTVTLVVILTLAIGIGANTAIFSVVNGVLIKPLPYPNSDRLITMSHTAPGIKIPDVGSAPFLYFTEREQNRTLEGVGMFASRTSTVTGRGEPEVVQSLFVTSDILRILGIQPQIGRYFTDSDDQPGSPNTIVITYEYWQRHFGGNPSVIGQSLTIDGQQWDIIGVTPQRFRFLSRQTDVISPYQLDRTQTRVGGYFGNSIARLKPGVTLQQASADVERMIPIAIESFPPVAGYNRQQVEGTRLGPRLRPLKQDVVGDAGNTLWVLMGTIGVVLLIACANVANLILVRTEWRKHELSIRAALGAGSGRIARQLLTESLVMGLAGGIIAVGFAYAGLRALLAMAPANLPRAAEIAIEPMVLLFTLVVSLLSGLFFGAIPIVRYCRPQLAEALHVTGRWSTGSVEKLRTRGILVVAQIALALVLLISAGLMIRTFGN